MENNKANKSLEDNSVGCAYFVASAHRSAIMKGVLVGVFVMLLGAVVTDAGGRVSIALIVLGASVSVFFAIFRFREEKTKVDALGEEKEMQCLCFDSEGFSNEQGDSTVFRAVWSDVVGVSVFKRDLLTVDLICIRIELSSGEFLEVDEEMVGWTDFVEVLPRYLMGVPEHQDWFSDLAFPTFKANWRVLYQKG